MNFAQVQQQLNDLPATFKRLGPPFTQFIDAETGALTLFTNGSDGVMTQTVFANAQYGWVDIWGLLFNVPRRAGEADPVYIARIHNTLLAPHTTPVALYIWILLIEGVTAVIGEKLPDFGYTLTFPPILLASQINQILLNLGYVRPAGMPFSVNVQAGGTFLDTVDYVDLARATGEYLGGAINNFDLNIPASTNNAQPLLPSLLFTDPTINPSLA